MRVTPGVLGFEMMEVAAQHHDKLRCVLKPVDADKQGVMPRLHMA